MHIGNVNGGSGRGFSSGCCAWAPSAPDVESGSTACHEAQHMPHGRFERSLNVSCVAGLIAGPVACADPEEEDLGGAAAGAEDG